jgi:gamma-glutamylcyclotransferase (GGCT)/AIG2-like uncharacterized protein YtfP
VSVGATGFDSRPEEGAPSPVSASRFYFAYGMNVNRDFMGNARFISTGILSGWGLAFHFFADIQPNADEQVQGVVWEISPEIEHALDLREGNHLPYGYGRIEVEIVTPAGRVTALTYSLKHPGSMLSPPDPDYLHIIYEGLDQHGLSKDQVTKAVDDAVLHTYQEV